MNWCEVASPTRCCLPLLLRSARGDRCSQLRALVGPPLFPSSLLWSLRPPFLVCCWTIHTAVTSLNTPHPLESLSPPTCSCPLLLTLLFISGFLGGLEPCTECVLTPTLALPLLLHDGSHYHWHILSAIMGQNFSRTQKEWQKAGHGGI